MKRPLITIAFVFVAILCACLCACSLVPEVEYSKEQTNLGFVESSDDELVLLLNTEVNMTTIRSDVREQVTSEAQEQLMVLHKLLDGYRFYTDDQGQQIHNLAYLNEHIGEGPIAIDRALCDALDEAITMAELTEGLFNPTIGQLVDVYEGRFMPFDTVQEKPHEETIEAALASIVPASQLRSCLLVDAQASTVELKPYQGQSFVVTLGAIGKGFALQQLKFSQDESYLLTAGASSIVGHLGTLEDEVTWNVATHEPDNRGEVLFAFRLDEGSVSTSGDDENYYLLEDGTRVHHILNPFTGMSENYWRNVIVVGPDAGVLDALSTALFNLRDEEDIVRLVSRVEHHYGFDVDYCLVAQGEGDMYRLVGNAGFFDRMITDYTSEKVDQHMTILNEDERR